MYRSFTSYPLLSEDIALPMKEPDACLFTAGAAIEHGGTVTLRFRA
jgi:hypothetical protein